MNQVLQAAAEQARRVWVRGFMAVVVGSWFVGWTVWVFLPRNRARFEEAARMPLTDGGDS